MAIRIRTVDGVTVALCAAETDEKVGDLYLGDAIHHALSTKFGLDWEMEGLLSKSLADPVLVKVMAGEKMRDAKHELEKWISTQRRCSCRTGTDAEAQGDGDGPSPIRTAEGKSPWVAPIVVGLVGLLWAADWALGKLLEWLDTI